MKKSCTKFRFWVNRAKKIERHRIKRKRKKYIPWKLVRKLSDYDYQLSGGSNFKLRKVLRSKKFYRRDKRYRNSFERHTIVIPRIFCLTRNPNETINTLQIINYMITKTKITELFFDYSQCIFLGLGASVITDMIVLSGREERHKQFKSITFKGSYPKVDEALQVFLASGLVKHLGVEEVANLKIPQIERLDPFIKNHDPNELTNRVIDYYNRCLKRNHRQLSPLGIDRLNELAGEIIDNLKNHSGVDGTWYVSGHFRQDEDRSLGRGSLVFISIGSTIYESLKETASRETEKKLKTYTAKQYGKFVGPRDEERAWTTLSLQYRISRLNTTESPDRGTGTIKFIESFTELGQTHDNDKPSMSITSGGVQVLFDGTYKIQNQIVNGKKIPVIAFNDNNDISQPPDNNAVRLLSNTFPGVIISVEFYVDSKYLSGIE